MTLGRAVIWFTAVASTHALVYANLDGPPPAFTGAPGEQTCAAIGCHDRPSNRVGSLSLVATDQPGLDTVGFELGLSDVAPGPSGHNWGFQLVALDSLDQPFGELVVADEVRTKITTGLGGRVYLSHTAAGVPGGLCNCSHWTFRWVAPAGTATSDRVFFHVAGLVADGDGTPAGDALVTSVFIERPYYCPVRVAGDANCNGRISSADILTLVSYIFRGGPQPCPCAAAGDVNCDGAVTTGDVIVLVNYVFKSGTLPCDMCPLILAGTWEC
jgi:hypothetical protein